MTLKMQHEFFFYQALYPLDGWGLYFGWDLSGPRGELKLHQSTQLTERSSKTIFSRGGEGMYPPKDHAKKVPSFN